MNLTRILPPLIPTIAINSDVAIAQTTAQPTPIPPPTNIDPLSVGGYVIGIAVAIGMLVPKIIERWLGSELEARQSKKKLETSIVKNQADLEIEDKQKQLEAARNLSDFYLETAKESQKNERELLMLFVTKELDASAQNRDQLYDLIASQNRIISRLELIEEGLLKNAKIQHDIMNVLNMTDRKED